MTNYTKMTPDYRKYNGFTIKFNDYQYSWSEDNENQRKYLRESDYIKGAEKIFVGKFKFWVTPEQFKKYLENENYNKINKEAENMIKDSLETDNCCICNSEFRLIQGSYGYFFGCSSYPKCKNKTNIEESVYDKIYIFFINVL